MKNFFAAIGVVVVAVIKISAFALLMAYPTKWVVNYLFAPSLLTAIFGVTKISVWQALLLNFICGTLFKGSSGSDK